jgi:mono/diheme cytochrome c family protein
MVVATDRRTRKLLPVLASFLLLSSQAVAARAADDAGLSRGEALYTNHCMACHTCKAHTRREPLVKNLGELAREVDRWQANQKLDWKSEEQADVVDYLNSAFYRF